MRVARSLPHRVPTAKPRAAEPKSGAGELRKMFGDVFEAKAARGVRAAAVAPSPFPAELMDELVKRVVAGVIEALKSILQPPAGQPPAPVPPGAPPTSPGIPNDAPIRPTGRKAEQVYVNTIQNPRIAPKPSYRNDVHQAIDRVMAQGTGLDPNDRNRIVDYDAYHQAVVTELRRMGYRAFHDGEEIQVRRPGDDHSEHYDISTSTGLIRRFYAAWLSPPEFE